jgi:hypothetical protein
MIVYCIQFITIELKRGIHHNESYIVIHINGEVVLLILDGPSPVPHLNICCVLVIFVVNRCLHQWSISILYAVGCSQHGPVTLANNSGSDKEEENVKSTKRFEMKNYSETQSGNAVCTQPSMARGKVFYNSCTLCRPAAIWLAGRDEPVG